MSDSEAYTKFLRQMMQAGFPEDFARIILNSTDLSALHPDFPVPAVEGKAIYGHGCIPHLFENVDGIASSLAAYIATQERFERRDKGDVDAGQLPSSADFNERGVDRICRLLLQEIEARQDAPLHAGHCPPDGGPYFKSWCYALHVYCANRGERATPMLLNLTFRTLDQSELTPPPRLSDDLRIHYSKKRPQYLESVFQDGEHWAEHGTRLSDQALADRIGVDRKSIANWRKEDDYQRRLQFAYGSAAKIKK